VKYLQSLKQDETILGGAEFRSYAVTPASHLVLDGATLQNLEVSSFFFRSFIFLYLIFFLEYKN